MKLLRVLLLVGLLHVSQPSPVPLQATARWRGSFHAEISYSVSDPGAVATIMRIPKGGSGVYLPGTYSSFTGRVHVVTPGNPPSDAAYFPYVGDSYVVSVRYPDGTSFSQRVPLKTVLYFPTMFGGLSTP